MGLGLAFTERTYVECFWFLDLGDRKDFMGCLFHQGDEQWQVKYRFRYHHDQKVFDSDDVRSWYVIKSHANMLSPERVRGDLFETMQSTTAQLGERCKARVELAMVRGDGLAAVRAINAQRWGHVRMESEGSA